MEIQFCHYSFFSRLSNRYLSKIIDFCIFHGHFSNEVHFKTISIKRLLMCVNEWVIGHLTTKNHCHTFKNYPQGCRDRLQKLLSLVQSTWPNHDVELRILDGWIKPPTSLLRQAKVVTKRDYVGRHKQTLQMSVVSLHLSLPHFSPPGALLTWDPKTTLPLSAISVSGSPFVPIYAHTHAYKHVQTHAWCLPATPFKPHRHLHLTQLTADVCVCLVEKVKSLGDF